MPKNKEKIKKQIISLMGYGVENIKEGSEFTKILNITTRTFTDLLGELRTEYPIVSRKVKPTGYFIATKPSEIKEYMVDLKNMIRGCKVTLNKMECHLEKIEAKQNGKMRF